MPRGGLFLHLKLPEDSQRLHVTMLPFPLPGRLPTLQTVRYGSKAVTRHRRVMHFERQKLMALTEYIPPKPAVNPRCLPSPPSPPQEVRRRLPVLGAWMVDLSDLVSVAIMKWLSRTQPSTSLLPLFTLCARCIKMKCVLDSAWHFGFCGSDGPPGFPLFFTCLQKLCKSSPSRWG